MILNFRIQSMSTLQIAESDLSWKPKEPAIGQVHVAKREDCTTH